MGSLEQLPTPHVAFGIEERGRKVEPPLRFSELQVSLMATNTNSSDRRPQPGWSVHKPAGSGDPRGRGAQTPTDIPPKGWRDVLLRVFHGISKDRITTISGGVTFFVLLALFPGLAGLISLYGLFTDSSTIGQHLNSLAGIVPEGGEEALFQVARKAATAYDLAGLRSR
jgi:hypothetical protein